MEKMLKKTSEKTRKMLTNYGKNSKNDEKMSKKKPEKTRKKC